VVVLTGNLTAPAGTISVPVTFFRTALVPPAAAARPAARASAWARDQVYLAHFALTDTGGARFRAWSRTSRDALGLAGAQAEPFRVWLEDWSVSGEEPTGLPMRLRAAEGDVAVTLALDSAKPPVLHGDRGLSRKGSEPGNASLYYSLTRMPARGEVRVAGETFPVTGLAWMDREWSTSALARTSSDGTGSRSSSTTDATSCSTGSAGATERPIHSARGASSTRAGRHAR
jgi:predicted secreted hydrolase